MAAVLCDCNPLTVSELAEDGLCKSLGTGRRVTQHPDRVRELDDGSLKRSAGVR